MPKILQLDTHVANLIAAGEVVERPASVVKELLENAVDAGASKVTVEIRDGGMTFLRVTDDGCGMAREDAKTAFLRHATSKLRSADDLAAIGTMGFRGEALAAISSVSRIDLMTKTAGAISGVSLHLEAGQITEEGEAGCPEGTTIIIRDLFFNTPARMKFMKSDTVEGARVASAVQMQALAHPEVAIQFLRDGKQILSTPGTGGLQAVLYCVYGRDCARMVEVQSRWENYTLTGYISKPSDSRPSRSHQTFFVNNRPVKSRLLVTALEEAYRNQIMVGKFPACVLHLTVPASAVDVNVHPAKTEVKFLSEKAVFDCVHYGILGTLNKTPDRPQVHFKNEPREDEEEFASDIQPLVPNTHAFPPKSSGTVQIPQKKENFFRTMNPEEYKAFTAAVSEAPRPQKQAAAATLSKMDSVVREPVMIPRVSAPVAPPPPGMEVYVPEKKDPMLDLPFTVDLSQLPQGAVEKAPEIDSQVNAVPEVPEEIPQSVLSPVEEVSEAEQTVMDMPPAEDWRLVGELFRTYIIVEQGDNTFLIDKHAAHERINFERLKANQEGISGQALITPVTQERSFHLYQRSSLLISSSNISCCLPYILLTHDLGTFLSLDDCYGLIESCFHRLIMCDGHDLNLWISISDSLQ